MQKTLLLALIVLCSLAAWAADKVQPLDIKIGLWEVSHTSSTTGMPPISPEALANMTPEQRATFMAAMQKRPGAGMGTTTNKDCITQEDLNKETVFGEDRKECTHTVITSTGSKLEMKLQCERAKTRTDGTFRVDVINSENIKGAFHMKAASAGQAMGAMNTMNVDSTFTGRWLGPVCGNVQ